jgi:hypothetical protein
MMQLPSPPRPLLDSRGTLATPPFQDTVLLVLGLYTGSKTLANLFLKLLDGDCASHTPTDFDLSAPQVVRTVGVCNRQFATAHALWRQWLL